MTPEIAVLILRILTQYGPVAARAARDLIAKKEPTLADFDALFAMAEKPASTFYSEAAVRAGGPIL